MAVDVSSYKGLIFDMDGTLIDTMPSHLHAWQQTAEQYNFPFDQEWIYSLGGMPSRKVAMQLNERYHIDIDPQKVADTKTRLFRNLIEEGCVITCTFQVLKQFYGKKKLAIGTGSNQENAIKLLEYNGILPMLDAVVTAADVENHKPNPDTFLLAAQRLGLKPEDCVVFEDTEIGKQAALAAGMACIMVVNGQLIV
ncbi:MULTISPECIES: beta-phosphoglucomutase family hydrolase [Vibrio]|uniref:Beta-phosphoglucomutase family hydrolase n=1 Tax=Vibrio casei TaxID=673372 RepID=A0A368LHW2_9VIBR|nr:MULTISPECIES: beta-phosphoglucomutase family hydrolase [Vibrio]RCS70307.1 beta-phosphoglucomutase family hydrolase [Vibrio casei]HBV76957.1 beta-phosphoglucomutase family hydrolase [Vibrio sp.]